MKRKIIHILCHSLENGPQLEYHVFGNWAARLAKNILVHSNRYKNEVWYVIRNLKKRKEFIKDNITYKLFPATTLSPTLESYFAIIQCPQLFNELRHQKIENTVVHFQGERGTILHKTLSEFSQFHITVQYHGYGQPPWLEWLEKLLIVPMERKNFLKVAHFFVHIRRRIEYLKNYLHISPEKISYQNVGIDFNIFKPRNKNMARKKLHIPPNAFVMLYVGHMIATKGVDKILKIYRMLKKQYPQLYLLFVGAEESDPLYDEAVKTADKVLGILNNNFLPYYYNAADLYCFFGDAKTTNYAGPGTAIMEALASNLNVVSTSLMHFPDKIINKIGLIPKDFDDFANKIEFLVRHYNKKFNPRDKIAPYTAYEYQTNHLIKVYDGFFSKKN